MSESEVSGEESEEKKSAVDGPMPIGRHESRSALVQLLLIIAAGILASLITGVTKTVFVVLAIVLMVMIHEFGHFVTAKWSGMKVTEYFLGFGPRLWSFRRGETEYGIRAIPAGGFVRVIGMSNLEEVDPAEEHRSFRSSPVWRRVVMASAGSFMHFVMAFLIAFCLLVFVGLPTGVNSVGGIIPLQSESPAQKAGIQVGDQFETINGKKVSNWDQVSDQLSGAPVGVPINLTVVRDGKSVPLTITPMDRRDAVLKDGGAHVAVDNPNVAEGFIGIQGRLKYVPVGPVTASNRSAHALWAAGDDAIHRLVQRFSPHGVKEYYQNVTGTLPKAEQAQADQNRLVSPVGLVGFANDAADAGWFAVLMLLFSINVFIGIFNMVPLLPMDGGHVAVAIYEKIRSIGKHAPYHADYAKLVPVSYAVILILFLFSGASLWLDIVRPQANPFK